MAAATADGGAVDLRVGGGATAGQAAARDAGEAATALHPLTAGGASSDDARRAGRRRAETALSGVDKPVAALLGLAVLALALLGLRIRMLTVRLQRAARLQCAMATATNLILEARADTASACLAGALAVVGGAVDADHAYVVGSDVAGDDDAHIWSRPGLSRPSGWPEAQRGGVPRFSPARTT